MSDSSPSLQYGPRIEDPHFRPFIEISDAAFRIYRDAINDKNSRDALSLLYRRFGYQAETTSWGLRFLASNECVMPAIALMRVRLEQTIVTSYILHENPEKALKPYLLHHPIDLYRANKEAIKDDELQKHLSRPDHEALAKAAVSAKSQIDPTYADGIAGLNKSKWSDLDLLSMAKRRDLITKDLKQPSSDPLERSYVSFYRDLSSAVHSSGMAISPEFLQMTEIENRIVIAPEPKWSRYIAMFTAYWDILTAYELTEALGLQKRDAFIPLNGRFIEARDTYVADLSPPFRPYFGIRPKE